MPREFKVTLVTSALKEIDPRRSLMAATMWLVALLAASFAAAASYWAGSAAEEIVVQQHVRRLALETEQLASDLSQAVAARLDAARAMSAFGPSGTLFARLESAYPDLGWLALADTEGRLQARSAGTGGAQLIDTASGSAAQAAWFAGGLRGPWIGEIAGADQGTAVPVLGELSAPVHDPGGQLIGVFAARLDWHWAAIDIQRLSTNLNPNGSALALVLDRDGTVLVGPAALRNRPWNAVALGRPPPIEPGAHRTGGMPRFERLNGGSVALVARAPVLVPGAQQTLGWQVQLSEPKDDVYQRASALRLRILWISVGLGLITALLGALAARRLTERLKRLTRSAANLGRDQQARFEVPPGRDEVAQLGRAFAHVLQDLRRERSELLSLSEDLERRVAARTREVERLAEESRYAAVVRERLNIARALHDTLAHSMMAMLSEVRLLRKLHAANPAALGEELERAESVAHEGLNEARSAITQMRVTAVRDTGLGAALQRAFERCIDRSGLKGDFFADPEAARFADERAETMLRMAEEALRNVERHAQATQLVLRLLGAVSGSIELSVSDDGIGFDPAAQHVGHYGLVGLREQAQLIGADLHIESAPGQGARVRVRLRVAPNGL